MRKRGRSTDLTGCVWIEKLGTLSHFENVGVRSYRQGHPVVTREATGSSPVAPVANNIGMLHMPTLCTRGTDGCKRRDEDREVGALSKLGRGDPTSKSLAFM